MIKVHVTKKDINKAKKLRAREPYYVNSCSCCPIALALKRTQKKKVKVDSSSDILIGGKYYTVVSREDEKLVDGFIDDFDAKKKVKPITFSISR